MGAGASAAARAEVGGLLHAKRLSALASHAHVNRQELSSRQSSATLLVPACYCSREQPTQPTRTSRGGAGGAGGEDADACAFAVYCMEQ